jgi:hypothetical protein
LGGYRVGRNQNFHQVPICRPTIHPHPTFFFTKSQSADLPYTPNFFFTKSQSADLPYTPDPTFLFFTKSNLPTYPTFLHNFSFPTFFFTPSKFADLPNTPDLPYTPNTNF